MIKKISEANYLELKQEYEWLCLNDTIEDYLDPEYYNKILRDYSFSGESDLLIFEKFLARMSMPKTALELGCGSGRVTDAFIKFSKHMGWECQLDILDLSSRMLNYCKQKYSQIPSMNYINSDTFKYLEQCEKIYDVVYSLWSYSHSIHQILPTLGEEKGKEYIVRTLRKFLKNNLSEDGRMFIIHFDTKSEEQSILIEQWKKLYKMFDDTTKQSPSLQITEDILEQLKIENEIDYSITHLVGDGIIYKNESSALETFLNFHMESEFNDLEVLPQVISELKDRFSIYCNKDGTITIRPGCFVIEIQKR